MRRRRHLRVVDDLALEDGVGRRALRCEQMGFVHLHLHEQLLRGLQTR